MQWYHPVHQGRIHADGTRSDGFDSGCGSIRRAYTRSPACWFPGKPGSAKDIYQDYDITFFVEDITPYNSNPAWVEACFGKPLMMQMPETIIKPVSAIGTNLHLIKKRPGKPVSYAWPSQTTLDIDALLASESKQVMDT